MYDECKSPADDSEVQSLFGPSVYQFMGAWSAWSAWWGSELSPLPQLG